jgi:CHAT domain-containing protein
VTPGEGVIGMAWALFAAGAQAAVVSQWKVDSASTTPLVIAFHTELRTRGVSRAEALRRASKAMRRISRYSHPYYWAGFVVVGAGAS